MSVLLKSLFLLMFCLMHAHRRTPRKRTIVHRLDGNAQTRPVTALWRTQTDFKSCFIKCHQDNVCASFKFKHETSQCAGYPGNAFTSGAGRHGILFNFCKSRICSKAISYTWLAEARMCIRVNLDPVNWSTSCKICRKENADLAVLNSNKKHKSIQRYLDTIDPLVWKKMLKGRRLWVGMNRLGKKRYSWINGKSKFMKWGRGDPSYGAEGCAMLTDKGLADVSFFHHDDDELSRVTSMGREWFI